jgi:hypothetical protein
VHLHQTFGLPEEVRTVDPGYGDAPLTYTFRPVEIVLPVTDHAALVWSTDGGCEERTLLLREDGHEDAQLGWFDPHAHPYCLRLDEAEALADTIASRPMWYGSAVPLLLLLPFVGITTREDAERWVRAKAGALRCLGLVAPDQPVLISDDQPNDALAEMGVERLAYECGGVRLVSSAATGLRWIVTADGDWELVAHKPWDTIRHLRQFDWPVPSNTLRARNPFRFFPEAAAKVASNDVDPCDAPPVFPFERMRRVLEACETGPR